MQNGSAKLVVGPVPLKINATTNRMWAAKGWVPLQATLSQEPKEEVGGGGVWVWV